MSKPRVLIIGPFSSPEGGIQTLLRDLVAGPLGEQCELVTFDSSKRTRPDRWLITGIASQLRMLSEYALAIIRHLPVAVHVNVGGPPDFYRKSADVLVARLLGRRVVLQVHAGDFAQMYDGYGPRAKAYIRWILRRSHRVIATSQHWHNMLLRITDAGRLVIIPNGIRGGAYRQLPAREQARAALGVPQGRCLVASLGRMGLLKGIFDLVEAAAIIKRTHPEAYWIAAGPDDYPEPGATGKLLDRIKQLGLSGDVHLPGLIDAVGRSHLYGAADLFVMPSRCENFPMVLLEAMAAGLPIVATRVGAVAEMIVDGETGLLVEAGKPEALAKAVCDLLTDPGRAAATGRAGRERFEKLYEVNGPVSQLWAELYKSL